MHLWSHSFGHSWPQEWGQKLYWKLRALPFLTISFHDNRIVQSLHYCTSLANSGIQFFILPSVARKCNPTAKESRTPKETHSESTQLSDFLIIAWFKFTKLVHCCILFIKKCLCYVFSKLSNKHTKLKLENYSSVSILTAFFGVLDFIPQGTWTSLPASALLHSLVTRTDQGFLKDVPVLAVLIFIPAVLYASVKLFSARWRPGFVKESRTKSSANSRRLILQFPIVAHSSASLHLLIKFKEAMKREVTKRTYAGVQRPHGTVLIACHFSYTNLRSGVEWLKGT